MSLSFRDLVKGGMEALDVIVPEEMFGFDITPGYGAGVRRGTERKIYRVSVISGAIKDVETGRTLGYTPRTAKKKYKVKRRRRRWTQRDEKEMQWKAYIASIQAGRPGVPP